MRNGVQVKNKALDKSPVIKEGVKILWHSGYYDGVLSGVLEYQGDKCFFEVKREYGSRRLRRLVYRTFNIFKITPEQWKIISYWHDEFVLHVGDHCNYSYSEEHKSYVRSGKVHSTYDYMKEMYFDRYQLDEEKNGRWINTLDRKTQLIGWCTYDVLFGRPFQEWKKEQ